MDKDIKKIIESLSPNERKILPYLEEKDVVEISKKSNLDKTSVVRSLEYLRNKKIIELDFTKRKVVDVGVNGALYRKKGLPERRLLELVGDKRIISLKDAKRESGLSDDEFKASIGVLKKKGLIDLKNKKITLDANKEEISKRSAEEAFLEMLPVEYSNLSAEDVVTLKNLEKRKNIVVIQDVKEVKIDPTEFGKKIMKMKIEEKGMVENITPKILANENLWKKKKFRRYDVASGVPKIYGGKRHFVNQAINYAREIWTEMGFKEMTGNFIESSFWNFDALFTAQDHPVREMQDTFFLDKKIELPPKKLVEKIKGAHEKGVGGSSGWKYNWDEEVAKKAVLRTHTTVLSAQTLSKLDLKDLPKKCFAIGKNFRNETVDWSHGFEFNQTEGIVVDKNANFGHLLGYLKEFYKKMGFEKLRIRPAYFPYTEPSVEIDFWHPEKKVWLELGGAGIFRPEVTIPLLGEAIPVLAWGPGFDRILTDYYKIKDLRELYKNNISQLRTTKFWMK